MNDLEPNHLKLKRLIHPITCKRAISTSNVLIAMIVAAQICLILQLVFARNTSYRVAPKPSHISPAATHGTVRDLERTAGVRSFPGAD
jgi:hypothetical protein